MANLPETDTFDVGVYQLETTDAVVGGAGGKSNASAINLANRTNYLKKRLDGMISKSVAGGADVVLTASEANNAIIELTGALTGNINVIVLGQTRAWLIKNNTSGAYAVTVKTAAGAGVVCAQGYNNPVWSDGTSVYNSLTAVPTPPQFDNDVSPASTAFVQRAQGNLRGFTAVSASAVLTDAQIGTLIQVGNSTPAGQVLTLPPASDLPHGASYWIYNASSSVAITIACNAADTFVSGGATLVLRPHEFAVFDAQPTNLWNVLGTISAIQMKASLTQHGYQKLPSGLIMQWGYFNSSSAGPVSVIFPQAFPNECSATILTPTISAAAVMATVDQVPLTLATGFSGSVWNTSGGRVNACGVTYLAFGY